MANRLSFEFDRVAAPRPNFDPRRRGIPESWHITVTTRKPEKPGLMYFDPAKKKADHVRLKPPEPSSQRKPARGWHIRWNRDGKPLDKNGNVLDTADCDAAHIPVEDFYYKPPPAKKK